MIPAIRNSLNLVPGGSLDRESFRFKRTWTRTTAATVILLLILSLCLGSNTYLFEPMHVSGLLANLPMAEWALVTLACCLMIYTIRDFLVSFRTDIEMNLRIDQANHWLSFGRYEIKGTKGAIEQHSLTGMTMISSRAIYSDGALYVLCLINHSNAPALITCRFDSTSNPTGSCHTDSSTISHMLCLAVGKYRDEASEAIGLKPPQAADSEGRTGLERTNSQTLSQPGALCGLLTSRHAPT